MARWATHRVDNGSKALIAHALTLGWKHLLQDGTIDSVLWMPSTGQIELVDWKGLKKELTPAQQRLVIEQWPVRFISTVEQLEALKR